jgi:hypothetical protein
MGLSAVSLQQDKKSKKAKNASGKLRLRFYLPA